MSSLNTNHKISIIIPVYNVEQYLRQCLDSIINQTYKDLEIIVVDGGSTDNSGIICDEYAKKDGRIIVIHKENTDLAAARNLGLKIATGKYIGYIDGDDYIELDMYEKLYNLIVSTKSDIAVCNRYVGKKNGIRIKNTDFPNKKFITPNEALQCFYKSMYVWNKLYKIEIIKNIDFIETFSEDMIYNFNIFKKIKKIVCLNDCKNYYRYNPSSRLNTKKFKENRLILIEHGFDEEIAYCKQNNLHKLTKDLINSKTSLVATRLYYLSFEENPDIQIISSLQKIVKENIFKYLFSNYCVTKKLFAITVSINFSLAKFISRFIKNIFH